AAAVMGRTRWVCAGLLGTVWRRERAHASLDLLGAKRHRGLGVGRAFVGVSRNCPPAADRPGPGSALGFTGSLAGAHSGWPGTVDAPHLGLPGPADLSGHRRHRGAGRRGTGAAVARPAVGGGGLYGPAHGGGAVYHHWAALPTGLSAECGPVGRNLPPAREWRGFWRRHAATRLPVI